MVAPLVLAAAGSFASSLFGLGQSAIARKDAKKAASQAAAVEAQRQAQVDELIKQMEGRASKLDQDAAFNQDEGDDLMLGFVKALMSQENEIQYNANRNTRNDGLSLGALDYARGYDDTNMQNSSTEYASRYGQLMDDRRQAMSERQRELDRQNAIIKQTSAMRDELARVLEQQGILTPPKLLGTDDIEAEAGQRGAAYTKALDALSDRALSQGEAGLMRRGVDANGSADSMEARAEMVARLAPAYQDALMRAETDAQGIVEGKNKNISDRFGALRDARDRALSEAQLKYGAGLEIEAGLNPVDTGIYSRDVGSRVYDPSSVTGINASWAAPGSLDAGMIGSMASNSRSRASGDLAAAIQAISGAMQGASGGLDNAAEASAAAQQGVGTARAQFNSSVGNVFSQGLSLFTGGRGSVTDQRATPGYSGAPVIPGSGSTVAARGY